MSSCKVDDRITNCLVGWQWAQERAVNETRGYLAWITALQQMLDESCFSSGVLAQKHYHWFGIKITICLQEKTFNYENHKVH